MIMVHILTGSAAVAAMFGYICRLDVLRIGKHRLPVLLMHAGLAAVAAIGLAHAWERETDLQDVAGVVAACAWLVVSAYSWGRGVPAHAMVHRLPGYVLRGDES